MNGPTQAVGEWQSPFLERQLLPEYTLRVATRRVDESRERDQYVVLDQNVLRDSVVVDEAIAAVTAGKAAGVLLPDVAVYELIKGSQPESTFRASLRLLAQRKDLVHVTRHIRAIVVEEFRTGTPAASVVGVEETTTLRRMLERVAENEPLNEFNERAAQLKAELPMHPTLEARKATLVTLSDHARSQLPPETLKAIRADPVDAIAIVLLSIQARTSILGLLHVHVSIERAYNLLAANSVASTWYEVFLALDIYWAAFNGLTERPTHRVENDTRDLEYVLTAVCAGRLVTRDRVARTVFEAVQAARRLGRESDASRA